MLMLMSVDRQGSQCLRWWAAVFGATNCWTAHTMIRVALPKSRPKRSQQDKVTKQSNKNLAPHFLWKLIWTNTFLVPSGCKGLSGCHSMQQPLHLHALPTNTKGWVTRWEINRWTLGKSWPDQLEAKINQCLNKRPECKAPKEECIMMRTFTEWLSPLLFGSLSEYTMCSRKTTLHSIWL